MRTRVKICGITRAEDAQIAVSLGADAIGLVFYPPSPRAVGVAQATDIIQGLPPFVTVTALFVDPKESEVQAVLSGVEGIDLLQFHGEETPDQCERYGKRYMKAVRMTAGLDLGVEAKRFQRASALLVDTFVAGIAGGTGESFDWGRLPDNLTDSLVIAGGLEASNVANLITQIRPYGVDVSGGVEASKGIKDADKLKQFFAAVASADRE